MKPLITDESDVVRQFNCQHPYSPDFRGVFLIEVVGDEIVRIGGIYGDWLGESFDLMCRMFEKHGLPRPVEVYNE